MPCGSSKANNQNLDQGNKNGEYHCGFEDLDHSVLQHPLHSGVRNVKQILKCIENGSKEIKDIIFNECNIIYECKICASLFRSLANFMYHKRCYCKKHLCEEMLLFDNFDENSMVVQPESTENASIMTESIPKLINCTVDLIKTDLKNEKVVPPSNEAKPCDKETSQNQVISKNNKIKEKDQKKIEETQKTEQSMISRRTRDKNSQKQEKALRGTKTEVQPSKKAKKLEEPPIVETSTKAVVEVSPNIKTDEKEIMETADVSEETNDVAVIDQKKSEDQKNSENEKKDCQINTEIINKVDDVSNNRVFEPMKKIMFAKPRTIQIKKSLIIDSIRKNLNSESVGLTKIEHFSAKTTQCSPKIILKTIDGNSHAVFQRTDSIKIDATNSKNIDQNKSENEKLVLVLKKDSLIPPKPTVKQSNEKQYTEKNSKDATKQTEFHHLTRRKRLLARTDCNVQELKCLTCNTIFTSLKTLYFHMLSIHSKKRLYYPCPICKILFVQMYGVTRHLVSIHNKTKDQINKLRDIIKSKSVWKKVDDVNTSKDGLMVVEKPEEKEDFSSDLEVQKCAEKTAEAPTIKTIIKLSKNVNLHQCSKCSRVFGRKSSQVSHEKFCIMNAIKAEAVEVTSTSSPPPPVISLVSLTPKKLNSEPTSNKIVQPMKFSTISEGKVNIRPKRRAEKQMHKDFIDSQTLKWRSVNKVANNSKITAAAKTIAKNLEKKVTTLMNIDGLACLKCGKTFSSYSNLKRHAAIHVGWTRFKCRHCDYQAYNKSQCCFHVQKIHNVPEDNVEKSIQNLGSNLHSKKTLFNKPGRPRKSTSPENFKKSNVVPKLKIKKENGEIKFSEKKSPVSKKESLLKKDINIKREKNLEIKKEKIQVEETKKEIKDLKLEKIVNTDLKKDNSEDKKESESVAPVYKSNVPEYKKDLSSYKSLTTNNPTTIILSKKLPASSVQSIVTIPTESESSTLISKTFPLRSSPRKIEIKSLAEKSLTSLVTRSTAYAKSPIQIKITPPRPSSAETVKKSLSQLQDKTFVKKEKLISEWFPKKDLNSNTNRRESAPLIIGLVPASSSGLSVRNKNPAISYEKNNG